MTNDHASDVTSFEESPFARLFDRLDEMVSHSRAKECYRLPASKIRMLPSGFVAGMISANVAGRLLSVIRDEHDGVIRDEHAESGKPSALRGLVLALTARWSRRRGARHRDGVVLNASAASMPAAVAGRV